MNNKVDDSANDIHNPQERGRNDYGLQPQAALEYFMFQKYSCIFGWVRLGVAAYNYVFLVIILIIRDAPFNQLTGFLRVIVKERLKKETRSTPSPPPGSTVESRWSFTSMFFNHIIHTWFSKWFLVDIEVSQDLVKLWVVFGNFINIFYNKCWDHVPKLIKSRTCNNIPTRQLL